MVKNNGMARNSISRTVVKTYCEVKFVDDNNDIQETEIMLWGDYSIDGAQNAARKVLENNRLIVESVRHESFYGKMSMEQFAELCEKSKEKEW